MGKTRGYGRKIISQGLQPFILVAFVHVCAALPSKDSYPGTSRNKETELALLAVSRPSVLGVFFSEEASGQL